MARAENTVQSGTVTAIARPIFMPLAYKYVIQSIMIYLRLVSTFRHGKAPCACIRAGWNWYSRSGKVTEQLKIDNNKTALETARSRLAAYDVGDAQPTIPPARARVTSETSIPTPVAAAPILTKPVAAPAKQAAAQQGRRIALVIGNSAYKNVPALAKPQKDAAAIATSLRKVGFETVTLTVDATREKLIDGLRAFADESEKADWAIVYYAGHGIEVNGKNYLIPTDAKLATDPDVQFKAIPLDQVMAALEGTKKLKLVLLDACRDNPFAPQMRKTTARAAAAVAATSTAGGTVSSRSHRTRAWRSEGARRVNWWCLPPNMARWRLMAKPAIRRLR